ncbi:hypothetical protein [Niveispirillum sp.]|uniref:hypothetical protein n=1 Tax=Niveispirillum sp. TaxID=1917217 RepID=UPI001B418578|nr:hypothetical protein [Niveispirillum sp.]MBP7336226.1 hypothetical protein [Niveispirillum sp.]
MRPLLIIVPMVLFLTGCADQLPPLNFTPPNVGMSSNKLDAEVRSLIVTIGRPDEQKGDVDVMLVESAGTAASTGSNLTQLWKESLQDALNRMVIFKDDAPKKVNISVKVLKIDVPSMGVTFDTETIARYEITDRSNGDLIFTTDITSTGSTPMSHALAGVIRARESVNRSVQNNISTFLQQLETVDIKKPMFPASKPVS